MREPQEHWGVLASKDNYVRLRRKLVLFLNGRGCWDASQLADEIVMRLVQALSKGQDVRDVQAFAFGIAKRVLADWFEEARRPPPLPPVPPSMPGRRAQCLEACLRKLPPADRELVEAYFVDREREALAGSLGVTLNALRIRVCRLKSQLASSMTQCLEAGVAKQNWPKRDK